MAVPPITVLIVDDERLSRERLRVLLDGEPDITIVGECENGLQALDAITARRPELVFLDMQMPDLDGPGVLDALECADQVACPEFIFATAYSAYMERAFEVHAVDYLRKPYTNARFHSALMEARRRVEARRTARAAALPSRYAAVTAALQRERADGRIVLQDRDSAAWHLVPVEEIDWIGTDGSAHVRLYRGDTSYLYRKSLAALERELAGYGFIRVHRSSIVNTARIRTVKALQKGEYAIVLESGAVIDTGRTYRDVITRFLPALPARVRGMRRRTGPA